MIIHWLGHACFHCQGEGVSLLTDPFDEEVGYPLPQVEADVVTVSHDHHDHNAVSLLPGEPEVVREAGEHHFQSLEIKGFQVFHDEVRGAKRGENLIFVWEMDGLRLCHLGDLGHLLDEGTVKSIGKIDILMVPVGGIFTIDGREARDVVAQLQPRLVIPMHYKTPALSFELDVVEKFTLYFDRVQRDKSWQGTTADLPDEQELLVLDYHD
ncbi:MAG: MBL fold metallo-hydrolase [Syntrophaceticus sp.]